MLATALIALAVAILIAAAIVSTPETGLRHRTRKRCLVSCKDGQQFSGVLYATDRGCLILKNASVIGDGGTAAIDGEVLILRPDISFVQFP